MVAIKSLSHRFNPGHIELPKELLRLRDPTESHGMGRNALRRNATPSLPKQLALNGERFWKRTANEDHRVSAMQRPQRLAQSARRQQAITGVFRSNQNNVEVTRQSTMLEAVIQKMRLWAEILLGEKTRGVAILADHDRNLEASCHQKGLVPEFKSFASRVHLPDPALPPPVAARKNVKLHAARLQQFAEQDHERRLA